jgi:hypothetical protein
MEKTGITNNLTFSQNFVGEVVFSAGGWWDQGQKTQTEIYSPDGKCQKVMAPLPEPSRGLFLVFFTGSIVACSILNQVSQKLISVRFVFYNYKNLRSRMFTIYENIALWVKKPYLVHFVIYYFQ